MQVFSDIEKIRQHIHDLKESGLQVGFAPTMGALHEGHISLIDKIHERQMVSVCSIFVNPTQFNEKKDLEKYPRVLKEDLILLEQNDCDIVFIPTVDGIYPADLITDVDLELNGLDEGMEGTHRPGHFAGMLQVVNRLLEIVRPHAIFMGQKDYQQYALVRRLGQELHPGLDVVMCPIIRERSGLAMSSRNRRLSEEWKKKAVIIYKTLCSMKENLGTLEVKDLSARGMKRMRQEGLRPEYLDIVDGFTLKTVSNVEDHKRIVACTAAWAGEVRLIDNMILKG